MKPRHGVLGFIQCVNHFDGSSRWHAGDTCSNRCLRQYQIRSRNQIGGSRVWIVRAKPGSSVR